MKPISVKLRGTIVWGSLQVAMSKSLEVAQKNSKGCSKGAKNFEKTDPFQSSCQKVDQSLQGYFMSTSHCMYAQLQSNIRLGH